MNRSQSESLFKLTPYKLLLCHLVHSTKHSLDYLEVLEKYVIHATIHSTKLDELSFKNFKLALKNDIEAIKIQDEAKYTKVNTKFRSVLRKVKLFDINCYNENFNQNNHQRANSMSLGDSSEGQRKDSFLQNVFRILPQDLKDNSNLFKDNFESNIVNSIFNGSPVSGGIFDIFLRKCVLAFEKMMFEDLVKLQENYELYVQDQDYKLEHSGSMLHQFFDFKLKNFEFDVTQKSHRQIKEQFDMMPPDDTKFLLSSMNDCFSRFSIPAIENLRNVNTYNYMNSLHIRLGHLDQGLISLIECIKQAQNKKDNRAIIKCLIWLVQIVKALGNIEQAQSLILEQILIKCCVENLPSIFNDMVLEYARLNLIYQRHEANTQLQRIKRVKTQDRNQDKKNDPDDLIGNIMAAMQNNLIKMHHTSGQKDTTLEIKNFYTENKPIYRLTRAFQWGHESENALMLANLNSLVTNFPESLRHIDITNSMYQFISRLKDTSLLKKICPQPDKTDYHITKLILDHEDALKRFKMDQCRSLEDIMLLYNDKTNSQLEYAQIWECRLKRLFKEELYDNALISAKEFLKFCEKQGMLLKKVEFELFIAKVYVECDAYHEALFQVLKVIDKAEQWQMILLYLEANIVLAQIHLEMGAYYEALVCLNKIAANVNLKSKDEEKAKFLIIKAKTSLSLSHEVNLIEPGKVALLKASICDLDKVIEITNKAKLYQEMRESLYLKSFIFDLLFKFYHQRGKTQESQDFMKLREVTAKRFNDTDELIENEMRQVGIVEIMA